MKRKIFNLLMMVCLLFVPFKVFAANGSISVTGTNSAVVGSTVTVTVKLSSSTGIGSWEYLINYDSSMLKLIEGKTKVADFTSEKGGVKSKSYTLKFKALKSGSAKVSVGSYAMYAYTDESAMSVSAGSKTIKIMTQAELEATYSKNNNLKSIKVDGYEISPAFKKDVLDYTVELPSNVENIKVSASVEDSKARVSGTGDVSVSEGENKIELVVTAENGSTKTYTLIANVIDANPIVVDVNGEKWTVIKRASLLTKPELFTETTVDIDGNEIPAFYSEITKLTLVGLKNNEGVIKLFVYNDSKYELYNELKLGNTILLLKSLKDKDYFKKSTIMVNEIKYDCLKVSEKSDYALFYALNMQTGKEDYYLYDSKEQTLQRFDDELVNVLINEINEEKENSKILYIIIAVLVVFIIVIIITFSAKNNKIKKSLGISKKSKEKTILDS